MFRSTTRPGAKRHLSNAGSGYCWVFLEDVFKAVPAGFPAGRRRDCVCFGRFHEGGRGQIRILKVPFPAFAWEPMRYYRGGSSRNSTGSKRWIRRWTPHPLQRSGGKNFFGSSEYAKVVLGSPLGHAVRPWIWRPKPVCISCWPSWPTSNCSLAQRATFPTAASRSALAQAEIC